MNSTKTISNEGGSKLDLRERLKLQRQHLWRSAEQRHLTDSILQEQLWNLVLQRRYTRLLVYLANADEANTDAFIRRSMATVSLFVPMITGPGQMEAVHFPGWTALINGPFGIRRPQAPQAYRGEIDAVVVPGIGFTANGERLGYGKGFYDRWLAAHPSACRIGFAYAAQVLTALPSEAHDERLDLLVTEDGITETYARATKPSSEVPAG